MLIITTKNSQETKRLGAKIAKQVKKGGIVCLVGDLGTGKTTFTQGFLKALKVKGPYTSPTFLIVKNYKKEFPISKSKFPNKFKICDVYHIDAYRIKNKDLLNLGWKEMIADPKNITVIEWADRVKKIIPTDAIWINFKWLDEKKRKIILS